MAGPLPQQFRRQAPLASRETFALPLCRQEETPFSLCQGRELLTISSPLQYIEESVRLKEGTELFQTSNLDKRSLVLPCGRHRGKRSPQPHPLKQAENSIQVTLGKRRQLLSGRELLLPLSRGRDTLAREDRAPLASNQKSPLPHPRQEETESFLQSNETEKSSISIKNRQAPPRYRERRELRLPLSRQEETSFSLGKGRRS